MKHESKELFARTPSPIVVVIAAFVALSIYIFPLQTAAVVSYMAWSLGDCDYRPTANQNACDLHEFANMKLKHEHTIKADETLSFVNSYFFGSSADLFLKVFGFRIYAALYNATNK